MYIVVAYNWINDQLTDKCSVGLFRSLKNAKRFCSFGLPYNKSRNTVAILKVATGPKCYSRPVCTMQWCPTYEVYVPIATEDTRSKVVIDW